MWCCCRHIADGSGGGDEATLETLRKAFPNHSPCGLKGTEPIMCP